MKRIFVCILLFSATVAPSWAAVVRLVQESSGQYRIEGVDLEGVAALDLNITYEPATLQLSNISQGLFLQGMLFAGNPNQSGQIRIGAVGTQPINGSGILARFSGTEQGSGATFLGFMAKLSDASGTSMPVRTDLPVISKIESPIDPSSPSVDPPAEQRADSTSLSTKNQGSVAPVSIGQGNVTPPWSTTPSASSTEPSISDPDLLPVQESLPQIESTIKERPSVLYLDKQKLSFSPVLDAFEAYEGPRTLAGMVPLFKSDTGPLQQRPKILLADGKSIVEIRFPMKGEKEPSIALKNARLIRSGFVDENQFFVRCIPEKGAISAKILLLGGEELIAIPLTVSPRISMAISKVRPTEILPKMDLDGNGEITWKDDYILVANLLGREQKSTDKETEH